jgi:hypothetical protein
MTMFIGSGLLFLVQPMFVQLAFRLEHLRPVSDHAPLGYLYAHSSTRPQAGRPALDFYVRN